MKLLAAAVLICGVYANPPGWSDHSQHNHKRLNFDALKWNYKVRHGTATEEEHAVLVRSTNYHSHAHGDHTHPDVNLDTIIERYDEDHPQTPNLARSTNYHAGADQHHHLGDHTLHHHHHIDFDQMVYDHEHPEAAEARQAKTVQYHASKGPTGKVTYHTDAHKHHPHAQLDFGAISAAHDKTPELVRSTSYHTQKEDLHEPYHSLRTTHTAAHEGHNHKTVNVDRVLRNYDKIHGEEGIHPKEQEPQPQMLRRTSYHTHNRVHRMHGKNTDINLDKLFNNFEKRHPEVEGQTYWR